MNSFSVKHLWDLFSDRFGKTILHPQYFSEIYAWEAVELARREARGTLLDIGCGRMPYRPYLEPRISRYIALDHPEVTKLYSGKYKIDIYADATKIPLKNRTVDTVIMLMVLEHLPNPLLALQEARRVLKTNGVLILSTVQMYPIHDEPYDYFRYTKYGLKSLCNEAGFSKVSITSRGNFWIFWFQNLNVYLFQTLKKMLDRKVTFIIGLVLLVPFYTIAFFSNLVGVLFSHFDDEEESHFNLTHTVLCKTQI